MAFVKARMLVLGKTRSLADSADVCITLHAPKPCIASMEDEGSFAFRQAR